jgi:hypothetical protein
MACRLHNLHDKALGIDLRGGEVLVLAPNTTSRAIVEELLYDNHHLSEWERAGWIRRIPARMDDVIAETQSQYPEDPHREAYEAWRAEAKAKAAEEESARSAKSSAAPSAEDADMQDAPRAASKKAEKKAEK